MDFRERKDNPLTDTYREKLEQTRLEVKRLERQRVKDLDALLEHDYGIRILARLYKACLSDKSAISVVDGVIDVNATMIAEGRRCVWLELERDLTPMQFCKILEYINKEVSDNAQ